MDISKKLYVYFFIPILSVILYYLTEPYLKKYFVRFSSSKNSEIPPSALYSSVVCRGDNHTNRLCHFKHLCYDPNSQLFIFLLNRKSLRSGLPLNRFSPTLVDFSSVNDHNTQYFNFVEIPDTLLATFNVSYLKGNFLLFKRFNPENLMHVFHDDLLPTFSTLTEIFTSENFEQEDIRLVFADHRKPGPYQYIYENFLYRKPIYIDTLSKENLFCFQKAHIGLNKYSTWYQYGFKEPQGAIPKSNLEISALILSFRDYFLQKFSLQFHTDRKCAVLLARRKNRRLLNEEEIKQVILEIFGFETYIMGLEENSVFEIIEKIMQCQIIVGVHGSLLILTLFSKPFSILIEIFPYGVPSSISTSFKTLAEIPSLELTYLAWENKIEKNSISHPEYPLELGGIFHFPNSEQNRIKNSFVTPFLCCDNPVWLYRIYQDTFIDIASFKNTLIEVQKKKQKLEFEKRTVNYNVNIHPSEVRDCSCNISVNYSKTLELRWEVPWNIALINITAIEYELWIQDTTSKDVQAFITKKNYFNLKVELIERIYYIWIRCYADGLVGPFNSEPTIC